MAKRVSRMARRYAALPIARADSCLAIPGVAQHARASSVCCAWRRSRQHSCPAGSRYARKPRSRIWRGRLAYPVRQVSRAGLHLLGHVRDMLIARFEPTFLLIDSRTGVSISSISHYAVRRSSSDRATAGTRSRIVDSLITSWLAIWSIPPEPEPGRFATCSRPGR